MREQIAAILKDMGCEDCIALEEGRSEDVVAIKQLAALIASTEAAHCNCETCGSVNAQLKADQEQIRKETSNG
jgi:hypothetical protein